MGSKRIKIIIILLVLAAVAAAFFVRPKRFHVDRTNYELVSLHKPEYESSHVCAINRSGVAVGYVEFPDGKTEIVTWNSNVAKQRIPMPDGVNAEPRNINEKGEIVGSYRNQQRKSVKDSFLWSPVRGFQSLNVYDTLQQDYSEALVINDRGQIAGMMSNTANLPSVALRVYFFDPDGGLLDIGSLGSSHVRFGGMNNDGMIVGSSEISNANHAFIWTKQDGMKDIHSMIDPEAASTRAYGILSDGWLLIDASYPKGDNRILFFHPQQGIGPFSPFTELMFDLYPVGRMDRCVFQSGKLPWTATFGLGQPEWNNWFWERDHNPVLIVPEILKDKTWRISGMTEQGTIAGTFEVHDQRYHYEAFLLRPIRPAAPAGK
jgi:probable HAF family extracellular repeat protein